LQIQGGMLHTLTAPTQSTLYTYMMRSHDSLRDLLVRLLAAMQANATDEVRQLWNELDHELRSHMDAEERYMLPAFAHAARDEALALLRQHGQLRELLFDLGIAVDLHYIRYERSHEFINLLLLHAGREEKLMYRWADERLAPEIIRELRDRVAAE